MRKSVTAIVIGAAILTVTIPTFGQSGRLSEAIRRAQAQPQVKKSVRPAMPAIPNHILRARAQGAQSKTSVGLTCNSINGKCVHPEIVAAYASGILRDGACSRQLDNGAYANATRIAADMARHLRRDRDDSARITGISQIAEDPVELTSLRAVGVESLRQLRNVDAEHASWEFDLLISSCRVFSHQLSSSYIRTLNQGTPAAQPIAATEVSK